MQVVLKNRKYLYIGLGTFFGSLILYFTRRYFRNRLPAKFTQRFNEIRAEYLQNSSQVNEKIAFSAMNLVQDVADFIYYRDHSYEETLRFECLDNHEEEYEHFCFETMQYQHESMEKAKAFLKSLAGVEFKQVQKFINEHSGSHRETMLKYRVRADNVPKVDKDAVRKAYIYYAEATVRNSRYSAMMRSTPDQMQQQEFLRTFIVAQCKVKDEMLEKFGFDERFLVDLLDEHNLREEPEVKRWIDRLKALDDEKMAKMRSQFAQGEEGMMDHDGHDH